MPSSASARIAQKASFLVVDCGHATTTAFFFDVTDGAYRLLAQATAQTTAYAPHYDLTLGVQQVIGQIAEVLQRQLLDDHGRVLRPAQSSQVGVDQFILVLGTTKPLRTIISGLLPEVSVASARRTLSANYVHLLETIDLNGDWPIQRQLQAIRRHRPDLLFVAGGTEGGADERVLQLIDAASIGVLQFPLSDRPKIIYAGNSALRAQVRTKVGNAASLHVAQNVRPTADQEQLADAQRLVNELFMANNLNRVPGVQQVSSWTDTPPLPTFQALRLVVEYLATVTRNRVLVVDVGAETVLVVESDANRPEPTQVAVRPQWGMGRPAHQVWQTVGMAALARWLPEPVDEVWLETYLLNRELFPHMLPMTGEGMQVMQALLQTLLTAVFDSLAADWQWTDNPPHPDLLILRGQMLVEMPRPSQAILAVLNSFQPMGVFSVVLDRYQLLPAVGALGTQLPVAAVQLLERGVLLDLGWVVVVHGRGRAQDIALRLTLKSPRLGELNFEVTWGTLEIIPIPVGETAELTLKPGRGFDVGAGSGKARTLTIHGGRVGLFIDARGRPLPQPDDETMQHQQVRQWLWDTGG